MTGPPGDDGSPWLGRAGARVWGRSSRCETAGCVEVGPGPDVGIRDSKDPGGPEIYVSAGAWRAFVSGLDSLYP